MNIRNPTRPTVISFHLRLQPFRPDSDKLHTALHISVGALYPCSQVVREILKPENGVSKEILDLG